MNLSGVNNSKPIFAAQDEQIKELTKQVADLKKIASNLGLSGYDQFSTERANKNFKNKNISKTDQIKCLKHEIEELKAAAVEKEYECLEDLLKRGEKLEAYRERSSDLSSRSKQFLRDAEERPSILSFSYWFPAKKN